MNALKCRTLGAMRARALKTHTLYNAHARFLQENGGPYVCFQYSQLTCRNPSTENVGCIPSVITARMIASMPAMTIACLK